MQGGGGGSRVKETKFTATVSYLKQMEEPTEIPNIQYYKQGLKYMRLNVGAFDDQDALNGVMMPAGTIIPQKNL